MQNHNIEEYKSGGLFTKLKFKLKLNLNLVKTKFKLSFDYVFLSSQNLSKNLVFA